MNEKMDTPKSKELAAALYVGRSVFLKLLFLLVIALISPGCVGRKKKIFNQISSVPKNFITSISPKMQPVALTPAPKDTEVDTVMVIVIGLFIIVAIVIFIDHIRFRYKQRIILSSASVEPFFMPNDRRNCIRRICHDLQSAKEKICIASYWLTHSNIITALRIAARSNATVEVLFDRSTPNAETLRQHFIQSGIKFIESNVNAARMHHKFIIIDNIITWVGSANLTGAAFSKNYESMLRIQSSEIALRYLVDFKNLMDELGQSTAHVQNNKQSISFSLSRPTDDRQSFDDDQDKPVSDYQKKVLQDFGIDCSELTYGKAYVMIDRIMRLLGPARNMK